MTTTESIAIGTREEGTGWKGALLVRACCLRACLERPEVWIIETPSGSVYEMEWDRGTCGCTDYERHWHLDGFRCKHLRALRMKRDRAKKNARVRAQAVLRGEAA